MDHQPFENWLLENKELTCSEKHELNAHLQSCPSCTALAEVDLALKSVKAVGPAAGFTGRFQARLVERKQALRRRIFWGYFILSACAVALLSWLLLPVLATVIKSPANLLAAWLSGLVSIWAGLQALLQGGLVLFKVIPGFVPVYVWVIALLITGGWSLLWVFSLKKFFRNPQGV